MNIIAPVSSIMSTQLVTVNPEDSLTKVKAIFDEFPIHHIPVVRHKEIVGIISKSDYLFFMHGFKENTKNPEDERLNTWSASKIMTEKMAKVESSDPIRAVVDIFKINWFHAIPVVDEGELVGIVTTHDIIKKIAEEPIKLEDYQTGGQ